MRHVFKFIQKNISTIQFSATVVGVFVSLFVAYVTSRIAPLANHIDQVEARVTSDEQYIPPFLKLQQQVADMSSHVDHIEKTTDALYRNSLNR